MKAHLSFLLLFLLFICSHQNDQRHFAIVRAHCRQLCATKYSNSVTCLEQCSLPRACSLQHCHLFCNHDDSLCLDTCQSFTDAGSCDQECSVSPDVVVEESVPGTASINVSVTLDENIKTHVILLNQMNKEAGTNLTYDFSFNQSCSFSGLYPWFQYQIDVVSFYSSSCCISTRLWVGSVSFNVTGAEFRMDGDKRMSKIEFYPYPLPPSWIDMKSTGQVSKDIDLFPGYAVYNYKGILWSQYDNDVTMRKITEGNVKVKGGEVVGDIYETCHSSGPIVDKDMFCVYRGFGMGYLFEESLGSSLPPSVDYFDSNDDMRHLHLTIKPRKTCKTFPWTSHTEPLDLGLNCSELNADSNTLKISYRTDLVVSIKACFMSDEGRGEIDRPCCHNNGTDCIWEENAGSLKKLSENRSYLLYFFNVTDNSTCTKDRPCDGFYQRIDPQKIKKCPEPSPTPSPESSPILTIILSVSGCVLVFIVAAVMLLLWKFKFGNVKLPKELNIPWDGQGLGGELSRDAISKESYLDRGNFGYILGGKLKVKLDEKDELTKQYDVALKILKTKVDKSENVAETEENIKDAKKAMKAEIHIMKQIQGSGRDINDHVLRMYGYVVDTPPYILVLELCVTNLTRYLRRLRIQECFSLIESPVEKAVSLCSGFLVIQSTTMATRTFIEPLCLEDRNQNQVVNWLERLDANIELYLFDVAEKLPTGAEDKRTKVEELSKSILISSIGAHTHKLLKSYCQPKVLSEYTYMQLKTVLTEKLAPTTMNYVNEQFKFNLLKQEATESLSRWMARIKDKATHCKFGTEYDNMVRNRFITGLRDNKIRTGLIDQAISVKDDETISAEDILKKAIAKETANSSSIMNNGSSSSSMNKVYAKRDNGERNSPRDRRDRKPHSVSSNSSKTLVCEQCTLKGHSKANCHTRCRYCKGKGHIVKNCRKAKEKKRHSQHHVDQSSTDTESDYGYSAGYDKQIYQLTQTQGMLHERINSDFSDNSIKNFSCGNSNQVLNEDSNPKIVSENLDKVDNLFLSQLSADKLDSTADLDETMLCYDTNTVISCSDKPFLKVTLNGKPVKMELDTGSTLTCISKANFDALNLHNCTVIPCNERLRVANYQYETASCKAMLNVEFRGKCWVLPLFVVDCKFPTLLGRDWICVMFGTDWLDRLVEMMDQNHMNSVSAAQRESVIGRIKQSSVFESGVGEVRDYEACLDLKPDARAKFCKARPVPFAIKDKLETALNELVKSGHFVPVTHSEYASPIVPVIKDDGTVRVCGDYKTTVNPNLDTAIYPLPTMEDCLSELVGGDLFTKLDIKQAFNTMKLRPVDQKLATVNTHKGLFAPTRLPYGISSATAIFQRKMDQTLHGIPGVACRVDDIVLTAPNDELHIERLKEVILRLEKEGFKCRLDKCKFMAESIVYLGHEISRTGIKALSSKVETISKARYPESRSQLVSFLGAAQYYSRFIPYMSTLIEPLNKLRSVSVPWNFGKSEKRAFDALKKELSSDRVLALYNPELELKLDADASSVGIGAVLSQVDSAGVERPIEFISRTLSSAERNYSQIEKESLSIVWAVKRLHRYLFARPFTLVTDHKPLESIFNPHKNIPIMGVSRIQRWALFLSSYQYKIQFRPTEKHANADMCSRYPLPASNCSELEPEIEETCVGTVHRVTRESEVIQSVFSEHYFGDDLPMIESSKIREFTRRDSVLSRVLHLIKDGWANQVPDDKMGHSGGAEEDDKVGLDEMRPYAMRKSELSVDSGCVLWGSRVIIPTSQRKDVLRLLHATHMGMSQTKALARGYVWWPGLDADIERVVRECEACKMNQSKPASSVPHPWVKPTRPWERIHLDFCGPVFGSMWLVVICAYSKWIEVIRMSSTKSGPVIKELRGLFSRFGLPSVVVSDNGPQLVSSEMKSFMTRNGINHVLIPAYHPASNGQAESIVGKFKRAMNRMCLHNPDISYNLANWLMNYRNTPHTATGVEPSVAMLGRRTRNALSLLHPLNCRKATKKLCDQEQKVLDSKTSRREFAVGEKVLFWNELHKNWNHGTVKELQGSKVMVITTVDKRETRKHLDHVRKDGASCSRSEPGQTNSRVEEEPRLTMSDVKPQQSPEPEPVPDQSIDQEHDHKASLRLGQLESHEKPANEPVNSDISNRPKRQIKLPDRLNYSKLGGTNK